MSAREILWISITKPTFIYIFIFGQFLVLYFADRTENCSQQHKTLSTSTSQLHSNFLQECIQQLEDKTPASIRWPVLSHVSCDGVADFHISLVLSIIVHKFSVRSHQVHDDGVVHLEAMRSRVQCTALSRRQQRRRDKRGQHSQCSRCLHLLAPDCNKLCRLWKRPRPEPSFPSGRSTWGKTLQNQNKQLLKNNGERMER